MAPLRRRGQLASVGDPSGGGRGATTERDLHIQADSALRIYDCTGSTDKGPQTNETSTSWDCR